MAIPGWAEFAGAVGGLINKIPIQGKKERWKNEDDKLKEERVNLLSQKATFKMASRVNEIDRRREEIARLLKNSNND